MAVKGAAPEITILKRSQFFYYLYSLFSTGAKKVSLILEDDIKEKQVSIFTIGDDWLGQFDYLSEETSCVVTYLSRTPNISTTDVREVIQLLDREKMASVILSVESLLGQLKEF